MNDDNPLWYDYAEPEIAPSLFVLSCAALVAAVIGVSIVLQRIYWLPDRLWLKGEAVLRRLSTKQGQARR